MSFPPQRQLNWTESFPIELGSYITINQNIVLWKSAVTEHEELYQFSAQSDTCSNRFSTTRSICLIDFRYATLILSDIGHRLNKPYTPTTVAEVCMYMKNFARRPNDYSEYDRYVVDGVVISATNGIHVILFDMKCVEECEDETFIPNEYVSLIEPGPVKIARPFNTRFFVVNGVSTNPVNIVLPDGCIYTADATKWDSVKLEMLGLRQPNRHLHSRKSMNAPRYQTLILNKPFLPVYGSFIEIPENTILFRGYDTVYPSISDRPAYFGNRLVAEEYANTSPSHDVGYFATTKQLKLLDVRFLKVLLTDLLQEYSGDIVKKTTIAFGLCSFAHQLRLMKDVYEESIMKNKEPGYKAMLSKLYTNGDKEQPGVRVAETSNDGWVMAVLREVFDDVADGFISPELDTHYHPSGKQHPELIVFNPKKSGIVELDALPKSTFITVPQLIHEQFPAPVLLQAYGMKTSYIGCGRTRKRRNSHRKSNINRTLHNHNRNNGYIPAIEAFNDLLNRGDPDATQQYNEAIEEGKKLRKKVTFSHYNTQDNTKL
jgi:hypothetical protein